MRKKAQALTITSREGNSIVYGINNGVYPFHEFYHNPLMVDAAMLPALTVLIAGNDEWVKGCMRQRMASTLTSLELITEGMMEFESPRGCFRVEAGQLFIVQRGEDSKMTAVSEFLRKKTIIMPGELTGQIINTMGLGSTDVISPDAYSQSINDNFDRVIYEIQHCRQDFNLRITQYAFNILTCIRQLGCGLNYPPILRRTLEYIYANINGKISIELLCKFCATSAGTLNNLFNKYFSVSPIEYVSQHRIRLAKTMLLHENCYIKEIAAKLGYSNQYYFTADFKKRTGQTPTQFRNSNIHPN